MSKIFTKVIVNSVIELTHSYRLFGIVWFFILMRIWNLLDSLLLKVAYFLYLNSERATLPVWKVFVRNALPVFFFVAILSLCFLAAFLAIICDALVGWNCTGGWQPWILYSCARGTPLWGIRNNRSLADSRVFHPWFVRNVSERSIVPLWRSWVFLVKATEFPMGTNPGRDNKVYIFE